MIFKLKNNIVRYSDEELLDDLRASSRQLGKDTISYNEKRTIGTWQPQLIARRFGSWNNALHMAGLRITQYHHAPHALLFDNIYRLWITLGRQPVLSDLDTPASRFHRRAYKSAFGSWKSALRKFAEYAQTVYTTTTTTSCSPSLSAPHTPLSPSLSPSLSARRTPLSPSWRVRHLVMKRDNFRCKACGANPAADLSVTLHIDHIIPLSKGGTSAPANLQTLCATCNIGKGNIT